MNVDQHTPLSNQQKLLRAAMHGDTATIRQLAAEGIDLDVADPDGVTAFALATQNNHADTAMAILAAREAQYMRRLGAALAAGPVSVQRKTA
jgi:ankyrin repeat protein